jgi:hypothetical protein
MGDPLRHPLDQPPPPLRRQWTWLGLVVGGLGALVIGLLWAWWAEMAQGYMAPAILFPLLIGAGTGITVVGLVRIAQIGHRPTIFFSAVLAACLAAIGQHYVTYLDSYYWQRGKVTRNLPAGQDWSAAIDRMVPSFTQYLREEVQYGRALPWDYRARGWMVWASWAFDGLLTIVAALAVTIPAMHTPYCDRCRTWYRVTRNGKIDVPTAERLATLAGVVLPQHTRSRRYRVSNCHGGCSATCCELSWEDAQGRLSLVQFWLDAAGRNQVAAALGEVANETDEEE